MNQPQQTPEWAKKFLTWLNHQPRWVLVVGVLAFLAVGAWLMSDLNSPANGKVIPGMAADPTADSTGLALGVFARLILVVAAIYIAAMLIRRWQNGGTKPSVRQLSVLETLHLSQRRTVHLIRAGEQVFLIGATDQAVTLLGQIPAQAGAQSATALPTGGGLSFEQQLALASQQNNPEAGNPS
jgi:flagellar biosynthetic protein FliO